MTISDAAQKYLSMTKATKSTADIAAALEHDSPGSQDQLEDFRDATGHDPETWIDGWRSGSIPDTPENTRLAIHALGLRDAPRQRAKQTAALP